MATNELRVKLTRTGDGSGVTSRCNGNSYPTEPGLNYKRSE